METLKKTHEVGPRVIAVFGFSRGRSGGLHPVCAQRLAAAAAEARPDDVVLLSGWARRARLSEAELMARAWSGAGRLRLDRTARTTLGNALATAVAVRELAAREVVLVTSGWHARRAHSLLRAALGEAGHVLHVRTTGERGTLRAHVRELACRPLVPALAALASRRR
jgi:uncharacterized SAM-binding protein YcdF (DUF218 family)